MIALTIFPKQRKAAKVNKRLETRGETFIQMELVKVAKK